MQNVIKIDLCKSKIFASSQERTFPDIRKQVLKKLLEVSIDIFPYGDEPYPKGSFYKADGDAIYFLLDKPSVALRCAIEFMQSWYHEALSDFPECRIMIDQSSVSQVEAPGKLELVGKAFENISIFEKDLGDGQIFVTGPITEDVDRTMVHFTFFRKYEISDGEKLNIYKVNYLDPRTTADSSLIHALFVANPKATEARDRVIELFLIEYALERGEIRGLGDVRKWGLSKGYPIPPTQHLQSIISRSSKFAYKEVHDNGLYTLIGSEKSLIEKSRTEFRVHRNRCIENVSRTIHAATRSDQSTQSVDMVSLVEDYLSAVFSEIRMMANYFRHNHELFQPSREKFVKFDYILRRALPDLGTNHFEEWKIGFLSGLRSEALNNNPFLSAVFHNVLAIYYLNRSTQTSSYQIDKLRKRELYLDTNVLYALIVSASNHHEIVNYIITQLSNIGLNAKVFPFTIEEYEQSLESVEHQCPRSHPSLRLLDKNPWLLQEFRSNEAKYQGSMAVCRKLHSISKGEPITERHYNELDQKLTRYGLRLEPKFSTYSDEQVQELWTSFRNLMPSDSWDISKYWDFIHSDSMRPESLKSHDVHCIQNLSEKTCTQREDELGIQTMFLTLDIRRLLRLRKKYSFIMSPEQCLEFFLPYLFLADVPLIESESFPNMLLSAGLGTMLVNHPPEAFEMLRGFLEDPSLLDKSSNLISETGREMATALNSDRFKDIAQNSKQLDDNKRSQIANKLEEILENEKRIDRQRYYNERHEVQSTLAKKNQEIDKLRRTVRYWRSQARNK